MSLIYATLADLTAFNIEQGSPYVLPADPAKTALLEAAQEDLDLYIGDYPPIESGANAGRKLDPATLDYAERRAIMRATCGQALYRIEMGPDFFAHPQFEATSGPEFGTQGAVGHIGPLARRALAGSGLVRNVTSLGNHGRGPRWRSFAFNIVED